jgi:hypothetical protein
MVRVVLVRMGAFINSLRLIFFELGLEFLKQAIHVLSCNFSKTAQHHNIFNVYFYSLVTNSLTNILIHKIFLQLFRNIFITLITEITRRLILETVNNAEFKIFKDPSKLICKQQFRMNYTLTSQQVSVSCLLQCLQECLPLGPHQDRCQMDFQILSNVQSNPQ